LKKLASVSTAEKSRLLLLSMQQHLSTAAQVDKTLLFGSREKWF
jgi:hypothetical protein